MIINNSKSKETTSMTKPVTETVASDTLHPQNKSQMLGAALAKLAGLSIEDLSHYLNDTLAQVSDKSSSLNGGGAPDASGKNQASINMHPSAAVKESVKDDLGLILGEGEDLSEEIKERTATLFEAALETRIILERESLIEEMNEKLEEAYVAIQEEMADKLDVYLTHIVESWLVENEVAIESALRNELMEDFIEGMKELFAAHYFNMPEEKVEVVEELADKVLTLEARLDETLIEAAALRDEVLESKKNDIVNTVCEGLALTQAEKLRSLCESVEFDGDLDAYTSKVSMLKEGVTGKVGVPAPTTGILTEESDPDAAQEGTAKSSVLEPTVKRYSDAISRSVRK
jgi:hypothetical protein